MLIEFEGKRPVIGESVFIAPTAVIIGDVHIGAGCSIWFGAVIRGDGGSIRIGDGCSIQDNSTVHVPVGGRTVIGDNVTIGHGATLEGCEIGDRTVVGMNAVVLQECKIGEKVMIAAGSVVAAGADIPGMTMIAGAPAQVKKQLEGPALAWIEHSAEAYHDFRDRYLSGGHGRT